MQRPTNAKLLEDFPTFADYCWQRLGLPGLSDQQMNLADRMQNGPDRDIVIAFRGIGKTWLAIAFAVWRLRRDPKWERVLVVSGSGSKAKESGDFALRLIHEVDFLEILIPEKEQRQSSLAFDVAAAVADTTPSFRCLGILSQITGRRATFILPDDIETLQNSITPTNREKIASAVGEFNSVLKPSSSEMVHKPKILYLGTPQLPDSLYVRLHDEFNYDAYFIPARYPEPDKVERYWGKLAPQILEYCEERPGAPTDPKRFSEADLQDRRRGMSVQQWDLQFMLDVSTEAAGKYPIALRDLVVIDLPPLSYPSTILAGSGAADCEIQGLPSLGFRHDSVYYEPALASNWVAYGEESGRLHQCVMALDPAGRGHDEFAWAVVAQHYGYFVLLATGGSQAGPSHELFVKLALLAKRFKVNTVLYESNYGGNMTEQLFIPALRKVDHACQVISKHASISKEKRIVDTLAPIVQQHRLIVDRKAVEDDYKILQEDPENGPQRSLFYQMSRVLPQKDCLEWIDRLDALEGACAYWLEQGHGGADAETILKQEQDELQRELAKSWLDGQSAFNVDRLVLGMTLDQAKAAMCRSSGKLGKHWLADSEYWRLR